MRDVWDAYLARVKEMPEETRHLTLHDGHCTYLMPSERKFITPELIRATGGLVGEPD